jgi:hypothetical protein
MLIGNDLKPKVVKITYVKTPTRAQHYPILGFYLLAVQSQSRWGQGWQARRAIDRDDRTEILGQAAFIERGWLLGGARSSTSAADIFLPPASRPRGTFAMGHLFQHPCYARQTRFPHFFLRRLSHIWKEIVSFFTYVIFRIAKSDDSVYRPPERGIHSVRRPTLLIHHRRDATPLLARPFGMVPSPLSYSVSLRQCLSLSCCQSLFRCD